MALGRDQQNPFENSFIVERDRRAVTVSATSDGRRDGGGDIRLDRGGFFERQGARYVDRDIAKDFGSNRSQRRASTAITPGTLARSNGFARLVLSAPHR